MKDIIDEIRVYFSNNGVSQTDIAERLGVTKAYVNAIFTGRRNIGRKIADKFERTFGISSVYLLTGKGEMFVSDSVEQGSSLPLIPIDAMAGALSGESSAVMAYDCEQFIIPSFSGADFLIRVQGDSMLPKYQPGDIVACKRVALDKLWFQWGRVYIVDTRQGALLKRIEPSEIEGCVSIHSDNPAYKPFDLSADEINGVALVVGLIRVG